MKEQEEYSLKNLDNRSEQKKELHRLFVENLHQRNIEALKIILTEKNKTKYQPSTLLKMQLDKGWYCYYTDNLIKSKKTIFAMHGGPGNHQQYAGIQTEMKGYCRWINIVIPGMDGQDERRGDYDGSFSHFSQMILKLLAKLQIPKVILCCHSLSSTFSPLLLTNYPQIFEGYISVAGIKDTWNYGFMLLYQVITAQQKYYSEQNHKLKPWQFEDSRLKMYQRFLQLRKDITLDQLEIPKMKMTQFFTFLKLTNKSPQQMDKVFQIYKNLKVLKVTLDGRNDPYIDSGKTENTIYNLVNSQDSYIMQPYFQKLIALAKNTIEQRLLSQFGVVVKGDKIQEYFCFLFQETGHSVHRRRPKEISQILKIYIACLEQIDKIIPLIKTSL